MDTPDQDRFAVVANSSSGTASSMGEAALFALVTDVLADQLHTCEIAEPEFIEVALERAFKSDADAVVVIGGDGTCRTAAKLALATQKPVVFLPGGTMNLLPARHWTAMDVAKSLQALADGAYVRSSMDVGLVNDEIFLIAAAFGAAPTLARLREAHRASETLSQSVETLLHVRRVLPHLLRPSVRLEAEGMPKRHLAALAIVIGNADLALGRKETDPLPLPVLQRFECVGAEVKSPWDFIRVMARAFLDPNWRDDDKVTTASINDGIVHSRSRSIAMTLDGEVVRLNSPAHVHLQPNGIQVFVSAPKIENIAPSVTNSKSDNLSPMALA